MTILLFLIGIPAAFAALFPFMRQQKARGVMAYTGAGLVMLTAFSVIFTTPKRPIRAATATRAAGLAIKSVRAAAP